MLYNVINDRIDFLEIKMFEVLLVFIDFNVMVDFFLFLIVNINWYLNLYKYICICRLVFMLLYIDKIFYRYDVI